MRNAAFSSTRHKPRHMARTNNGAGVSRRHLWANARRWARLVAAGGSLAAAVLLSLCATSQAQMMLDRELDPQTTPFVLQGSLSPAKPVVGEIVEVAAEITSRVAPHTRAVVIFRIDGREQHKLSYVIQPYAPSIAVHEWAAVEGTHSVHIELTSPAGVRYTLWETRVTVRPKGP